MSDKQQYTLLLRKRRYKIRLCLKYTIIFSTCITLIGAILYLLNINSLKYQNTIKTNKTFDLKEPLNLDNSKLLHSLNFSKIDCITEEFEDTIKICNKTVYFKDHDMLILNEDFIKDNEELVSNENFVKDNHHIPLVSSEEIFEI